ncbi:MAG TPA: hypothetical protein VD863_25460 [Bradyrhizobium sp.]|nr:hypothetical protein [Bradyrhizobium sp.]
MDEKPSQFDKDKADSAVARMVDAFMARIGSMFGKLEPVYATYILERMLLILCHRMARLIDNPRFADHMAPATIKLCDAMADYRDSRCVDRG